MQIDGRSSLGGTSASFTTNFDAAHLLVMLLLPLLLTMRPLPLTNLIDIGQ